MAINDKNHPALHKETLTPGKSVALCRCWQSGAFPHCDGTHRKVNEENGDQVGPAIVKASPEEEADQ